MRYTKWFQWLQKHLDIYFIVIAVFSALAINFTVLISLENSGSLINLLVSCGVVMALLAILFYLIYRSLVAKPNYQKKGKPLKIVYSRETVNGAPIIKVKRKTSYYVMKVLSYAVLILFGIIILVPFFIAIVSSLTPYDKLLSDGFSFTSGVIDLEYYMEVLVVQENGNIYQCFLNTMSYILPQVFCGTFLSALSAYAFARIDFKGKNAVFFLMLSTMVIPGIITTFPSYLLFTQVYKVQDWWKTFPIVVPGMVGSVGCMFFLRQYFATLPRDLEEAAEMDGMGRFGMFLKIILPLSVPAIITQLLLGFNGCYNDYLGPLLYVGGDSSLYTVQLYVRGLSTSRNSNDSLLMAGGIIALLPTLILYLAGQKFFVEGIVMTGIK